MLEIDAWQNTSDRFLTMLTDPIEKDIASYFTSTLNAEGATPLGVGWNGSDSQRIRFDQMCKLIDVSEPFSVNDLGCGYGAFYDYLVENKHVVDYAGYDVSPAMVESALAHLTGVNSVTITLANKPTRLADYSFASGLFNVRMDHGDKVWLAYILETLNALNDASRAGFAFNALTVYSDAEKMRPDLYYADPLLLFDHCKRHYSRQVALLHDYDLYDFTILVRK